MSNIKFCPECGAKLSDNVKFCPDCGHCIITKANDNSNNKRDKVLSGSKKKSKRGIYFGLTVVLLVGAIIFYINAKPSKEQAIIDDQPVIAQNVTYPAIRFDHSYSMAFVKDGKIILPLDLVKEKKFIKFDYVSENRTMPILAYLTGDGKVVTAISLCEPCDSKDFHIVGSEMVCNSCGTTWDLNTLDALSGSCGKYPPDPVPSKVVDNEIQIDEYIVINWTRRNT